MNDPRRESGSYRDPGGYVFYHDDRVLRAVLAPGKGHYEAVRASELVRGLIRDREIIGSTELRPREAARLAPGAAYVVEHERVPFISYPFEWPFALLKKAARFHLSLQLRLLEDGLALSDATAYNVQFLGVRPVFIDLLSLRPYREGELWLGHHQFMQQFVHPLLLSAVVGVPYNAWYRGTLDGIRRGDLVRCLPRWRRYARRVFKQIVLPEMMEATYRGASPATRPPAAPTRLAKADFRAMLRDLDAWIGGLEPKTVSWTVWADYGATRTYAAEEIAAKRAAIAEFAKRFAPETLWDIGCNTGEFAELALGAGCRRVIGFDLDQGALHLACERAERQRLDLLPLVMELHNPTGGAGWRGGERLALADRSRPDAVLALALIHHLAIANNIPLREVVSWLVSLAPLGVVEFVHKTDPTVRQMLQFRDDIFLDYRDDVFRALLETEAEVIGRREITGSGRTLYVYRRRQTHRARHAK